MQLHPASEPPGTPAGDFLSRESIGRVNVPFQLGKIVHADPCLPSESSAEPMDLDTVPQVIRPLKKARAGCAFESAPNSAAAEQFRMMQRTLVNYSPGGASALLTSPGAGDGKSLNTHNLAWALAEAGKNTLILELDLRRPTQAKYVDAQSTYSVVDVLAGQVKPQEAVRRISRYPLFYIGLDRPAQSPTQLLRSAALKQLLTWARKNFEWIVIDGPPVLAISDVEEILPNVELVLMIARERVTPRDMLQRAAERLGKRLDFVIFNDARSSGSYGYGYGYK